VRSRQVLNFYFTEIWRVLQCRHFDMSQAFKEISGIWALCICLDFYALVVRCVVSFWGGGATLTCLGLFRIRLLSMLVLILYFVVVVIIFNYQIWGVWTCNFYTVIRHLHSRNHWNGTGTSQTVFKSRLYTHCLPVLVLSELQPWLSNHTLY